MKIPYPDLADLPEVTAAALDRMPPLNIVRAFSAAPYYTPGLVDMALAGLGKLCLTERQRELIIIEAASRSHCAMIFEDHQTLCETAGVTAEEMDALWHGHEPLPASFDKTETSLLYAARGILVHGNCAPELVETIHQECGPRALAEMVILAGYYRMVSGFANVLAVQPDSATFVKDEILPFYVGRDDS